MTRIAVSFLAAWAAALPVAAQPAKAFVLDRDAPSLTVLDVPSGRVLGRVALAGRPTALVAPPGSSRVVVLDRGPGKDKGDDGYQGTGRAAATIVDVAALSVVARLELGWGLLPVTAAPQAGPANARLAVVCPGYRGKKANDSLPGELVTIDLEAGAITGRVPLDRPVTAALSVQQGATAVLFAPLSAPKNAPVKEAELLFIDLGAPSPAATVALKGDPAPPVLSPDGAFLYALGTDILQVVSVENKRLVAALEAGGNPRGIVVDAAAGRVYMVGDGSKARGLKAGFGELRVLQGAELLAVVEVPPEPSLIRLSRARDRAYVVGRAGIAEVDLSTFKSRPIHVEKAGKSMGVVEKAGPPDDLAISADGRRGFVLYSNSSKLLVLDLEAHEAMASVSTGRGGIKFMKTLLAVAQTAASYYAGRGSAIRSGSSSFTYRIFSVGAANTSMALRPDGRFAYVLNSQTGDVTAVDAETGTVADKIGGGGHALQVIDGGQTLAVLASDKVRLLDMARQQKAGELAVAGAHRLQPAVAGITLVVGSRSVAFVDGSGRALGRADGFKQVAGAVVLPPAADPTH